MKNVKFLGGVVLFALLAVYPVYSNERSSESENHATSSAEIGKQLKELFSDVEVDENIEVVVKFSVDQEKGFALKEVVSDNKAYAELVKKRLTWAKLDVPSDLEGVYQVKIRFVNKYYSSTLNSEKELLHFLIASNLENVDVPKGGSVKLNFTVKDKALWVKSVEGSDIALVESVKNELGKANIEVPEGIQGNYQIKVSF
jgi:hypothetical protein